MKKSSYECPRCRKNKVRRRSYALWKCKSCKSVFAGGAYSFRTEIGELALRLVSTYE